MSWHDSTLGELARRDGGLIQTGPFGSQLHQVEYEAEGIPVVMPKDITDGRISVESVARVSEQTADRLERHKLKPRSIVLPRRGEVTKRAYIRPERERIKQTSRELLAELKRLIGPLEQWTDKEQTQAEVEVFILDHVYRVLPEPPYTVQDKEEVARLVYRHIWQQSASGMFASG